MLKQRIITAVVLGALVIWAVFHPANIYFLILLATLTFLGSWEWFALTSLNSVPGRILYCLTSSAISIALILNINTLPLTELLIPVASLWFLILLWLAFGPSPVRTVFSKPAQFVRLFIGLLLLVSTAVAMISLRNESASLLMYVLGIAWVADIGAFFVGRQWGRRKLAPGLSPGKSWEGAAGGLALVGIYAALGLMALKTEGNYSPLVFIIATLLSAVISIVGDLYESYLKRQAGVKDSGVILPGHGGILDRIDSLLASTPVFACILFFLG